jgi:hypothetical protein
MICGGCTASQGEDSHEKQQFDLRSRIARFLSVTVGQIDHTTGDIIQKILSGAFSIPRLPNPSAQLRLSLGFLPFCFEWRISGSMISEEKWKEQGRRPVLVMSCDTM